MYFPREWVNVWDETSLKIVQDDLSRVSDQISLNVWQDKRDDMVYERVFYVMTWYTAFCLFVVFFLRGGWVLLKLKNGVRTRLCVAWACFRLHVPKSSRTEGICGHIPRILDHDNWLSLKVVYLRQTALSRTVSEWCDVVKCLLRAVYVCALVRMPDVCVYVLHLCVLMGVHVSLHTCTHLYECVHVPSLLTAWHRSLALISCTSPFTSKDNSSYTTDLQRLPALASSVMSVMRVRSPLIALTPSLLALATTIKCH